MKSFFETNNKFDCNGCGLCEIVCPAKAITMKEDAEGFIYPVIDNEKCTNCGICRKKCSNLIKHVGNNIKNYVAINKNIISRKKASSGGVFELLAKNIIEKKGIVVGAAYDECFNVNHIFIDNLEDISKINGSKYVRSNIDKVFENVSKYLHKEKYVLFSGTPCQCYALKCFLKKDYKKLIICDVYCHSNPSPKIYKLYLDEIQNKENKKIKRIFFRGNKFLNIKFPYIEFNDGTIYDIKLYIESFINMGINRPCCSQCNFRNIKRFSDITIGDYWGNKKYININSDFGLSLISINTEKGIEYFNQIKKDLEFEEVDLTNYKFNKNKKIHKNRNKVFNNIDKLDIIKYMKKTRKNIIEKIYFKIFKR